MTKPNDPNQIWLSRPVRVGEGDAVVTINEIRFKAEPVWDDLRAGDGLGGTEREIAFTHQLTGVLPAMLQRVSLADTHRIRQRLWALLNETAPPRPEDPEDPDLLVFPAPVKGLGGAELAQVRFKAEPTWGDLTASDGVTGETGKDIALAAHLCGCDAELLGRLPLSQANRVRERLAGFFGS